MAGDGDRRALGIDAQGCSMDVLSLRKARPLIHTADLLLFRRPRSLIAIGNRGIHSHAAKASWWGENLCCLEVREWVGGRVSSLASQVERYPGLIDVYRVTDSYQFNREGADYVMRCIALNTRYGWWNLYQASLLHLFGVRLFVEPNLDDTYHDSYPPFCSQATAYADRVGGGIDPVPNLADKITEPTDLARSAAYRPLFTLAP